MIKLIRFFGQQMRVCRITVACFLLAICLLFPCIRTYAGDRTNVPLKNWGGFSVNRSWVYDALEKIALAGLVDHALLSTKPLSRMEVAKIVAQAVHRITNDYSNDYSNFGYLEDLLYQLIEEFGTELASMGVKTPLNSKEQPGFVGFKPVDNIQWGNTFASNSQKIVNNSGQHATEGLNSDLTLDGRNQIGDFLSVYYQPQFSMDKDSNQGRMQVGYGKLTYWNTELEIGRDSLWWGPGFRGSMLFSNNAAPLDQVRLGSAEPFRLPWIFNYLGPIKATAFLARLEEDRDFSHAFLGGYRASMAPSRFIEIGLARAFQFGGDGMSYSADDVPYTIYQTVFQQGGSDHYDHEDRAKNINNLASLDVTIRIPNAGRYIFIARDASVYGEIGVDDSQQGAFFLNQPGGLIGTYLTGFLGDPKLDFRLEYANTSAIMFTHSIYTSGFTYKDDVLSHFIGTDAQELYARLSRWIGHDMLFGLQVSLADIGPAQTALAGSPTEERNSFGPDFSYRFSDRSSIFVEYNFSHVENADFISGKTDDDHLFIIEFTHSL